MTPDRWTLALEAGPVVLPGGPVLVMGARADADFTALGRVTCVQGFAPDHDRLRARGETVLVAPAGRFDAALVQITKSRAGSLAAIAVALAHLPAGALVLVDGLKEEGIEAIVSQLRAVVEVEGVLSKAHGKLAWFRRPQELAAPIRAWAEVPPPGAHGYLTVPGGFSAGGPDRGSEILVALLPQLEGRVADWGAGWGYVAAEVLAEQPGIARLDLVEADHAMLEAARRNVTDPRARFHWADVARFDPGTPLDAILCNPPFHVGRRADPGLGRAFIASAARALAPKGRFFMVANRHLPYEDSLKAAFGTGRLLGEVEGYKIYEAARPARQGRAAATRTVRDSIR